LCGKCDLYAKEWADRAEKLWEESKAKKAERVAKAAATGK
jgi:hypothetical protein